MKPTTESTAVYMERLLPLIRNSNFISIEEVSKVLGLTFEEIVTLKVPLEEALRKEDDKIRVTYRPEPVQGFEID
jgi:hypothetical protein